MLSTKSVKKTNRIIFVCPEPLRVRLDQFLQQNPLGSLSNVMRVALDEFLSKQEK
jgi:hypothetical protein